MFNGILNPKQLEGLGCSLRRFLSSSSTRQRIVGRPGRTAA